MKSDWSRAGYWLLKFLLLSVTLAALAGLAYGLWIVGGWLFAAGQAIGHWIAGVNWKRAFFTACLMAIFFYSACAMRALARLLEAKTKRERNS